MLVGVLDLSFLVLKLGLDRVECGLRIQLADFLVEDPGSHLERQAVLSAVQQFDQLRNPEKP